MNEGIRFSEDVKQVSELKTRSAEIIGHVNRTRRPVLLTRRGRGVAVLLDVDEYERLVDRQAFVEAVEAGARAAENEELHPHEEALAILDVFGEGND